VTELDYFATTAKGLEEVLAAELRALLTGTVTPAQGGVHFRGSRADGYRACLWLRTANRVLQPLATFPCDSVEQLYRGVRDLPWEELLTPEMTLALDASVRDSTLTHSRNTALKGKDAIVDRCATITGAGRISIRPPPISRSTCICTAIAARSASTWPARGCIGVATDWNARLRPCARLWRPA
jgi:23S rRNA G2445 N2-methylase RlmL